MSRWTLPCLVLVAVMLLAFSQSSLRTALFSTTRTYSVAMAKDSIVKFEKSASSEDKQKIIADIKAAGGTVVRDDHVDSAIFPYVVVNVSPDQFSSLKSGLSGSKVVSHIEEDKEMHTQ